MARLTGEDEVVAKIGTEYDGKGIAESKKDMMTWTQFLKGRMGPAMKEAMKDGASHADAHRVAIKKLGAEWKVYKATGVAANVAVTKQSKTSIAQLRIMRTMLSGLRQHWLGITASIVAAFYTLKKAFDFSNEAAKFQQAEKAFANLAASHGVAASQVIVDLKKVSVQTISTANLMKSAGSAMILGIPAEKLTKMMEIARASSRITGKSVQQSFDDMALGTARHSRLILDNLGIIVKVDEANREYARTMRIVGRALTEEEQKMAFVNATMAAGEEIIKSIGVNGLTSAERVQKFYAQLSDLAIIVGEKLIPVFEPFIEILSSIFPEREVQDGRTRIRALKKELNTLLKVSAGLHKEQLQGRNIRANDKSMNMLATHAGDLANKILTLEAAYEAVKKAGKDRPAQLAKEKAALDAAAKAAAKLTAQQEASAKVYSTMEDRILAVSIATMKLTANKDELIAIKMMELRLQGVAEEQIKRYLEALKKQLEVEKALAFAKAHPIGPPVPPKNPPSGADIPKDLLSVSIENGIRNLITLKNKELETFVNNNKEIMRIEQARANIVGTAYRAMQNQMLSLIETGKFSVGAMAQMVAQQIKIELTGIAARSAVWAIFETAMGLKDLATPGMQAAAALHFKSAGQFAITAGMALAGAAATQALFGGSAQRPAPGEVGGDPLITTSSSVSPVPQRIAQQPAQAGKTIVVHVYGNIVDHAAFARELAPYIDEAKGDKVSFGV